MRRSAGLLQRISFVFRGKGLALAWRAIFSLLLGLYSTGCIAIQIRKSKEGKAEGFAYRLADRMARGEERLELINWSSPQERFEQDWFRGGEYVFVLLNRGIVADMKITKENFHLVNKEGRPLGGHAEALLRELHNITRGALDPSSSALSGPFWYTDRRLAAPRWDESELPPLKRARDRFYKELRLALGRQSGIPVERVRMILTGAERQEVTEPFDRRDKRLAEDLSEGLVACIVVHDNDFYTPRNYWAYLAGVDPVHVTSAAGERLSIMTLDVLLQQHLCEVELKPLAQRMSVIDTAVKLYQDAVTSYLDKREDSKGKLEGVDFIRQYLAATIISAFQRGMDDPGTIPVGIFVEITNVRAMDEIDGGRKYVLHRIVGSRDDDREVAKGLVKALRDSVELVNRAIQDKQGDALALKIQAAHQLSENVKTAEPVRRMLQMFVERARYLMPDYTQRALSGGGQTTTPADAGKKITGARGAPATP